MPYVFDAYGTLFDFNSAVARHRALIGPKADALSEMWRSKQIQYTWLRNGMGAESIAWTLMFALMPLACVYYPVNVLPAWLQYVAWALPPTYVFEGMRSLLIDQVFRSDLMVSALLINAVLLMASFAAFLALLRSAKRHGSLLGGGE